MGTISTFDEPVLVLDKLHRVASTVYFDFYPPEESALAWRKAMYQEEGWENVRIVDDTVVSDDGLESGSLSKEQVSSFADDIGSRVIFHDFHEFSVMAELV